MKTRRLMRVHSSELLLPHVEVAGSFMRRFKGLLGRTGIAEQSGLLLTPCREIHMWGMKFEIDALFLRRLKESEYEVMKVCEGLKPWKVLPVGDLHATDTLEVHSGFISKFRIKKGEILCIS
jgi:uncharacterized membrane protein (UPF0127 family)